MPKYHGGLSHSLSARSSQLKAPARYSCLFRSLPVAPSTPPVKEASLTPPLRRKIVATPPPAHFNDRRSPNPATRSFRPPHSEVWKRRDRNQCLLGSNCDSSRDSERISRSRAMLVVSRFQQSSHLTPGANHHCARPNMPPSFVLS